METIISIIAGIAIGYVIFVIIPKMSNPARDSELDYLRAKDTDNVTLNFSMTVRKRWVPHVLGMFRRMEYLGSVGSSRMLGFYSDGDGDFRPKFDVNGVPLTDDESWNGRIAKSGIRAAGEASKQTVSEWYDAG